MAHRFFIISCVVFLFYSNATISIGIDSLKLQLKSKSGKDKVILLNTICNYYVDINSDSAIKYGDQGLSLTKKERYKKGEAHILNSLGSAFLNKGDYGRALENYIEAEKLFEIEADIEGKILTTMNLGRVFELQGVFEKAIFQYKTALKISNEFGNKDYTARALNYLGSVYYTSGNKNKSLEAFDQSLKINQDINNTERIMEGLNNVAVIYQELGRYSKALENFYSFLRYSKLNKEKKQQAISYHNIGLVYKDQKDYGNAINYVDSSIAISKEIRDFDDMREAYSTLSEIFTEKKNYQKALAYFSLSSAAKDSLSKQNQEKAFAEMSTKYETEKKEKENLALRKQHEIELAVAGEREKKLNVITYAIGFGLVIVLLFSFILSGRLKITRQQKRIIESQKHIVDEKQKEILDSIHYAQRIQNAILAKEEDIKKYFPESFLFYKPKDIVAGDFYFFDTSETHVFYAAADCTGHGVPGALVSVVCANALSRCVKEFEITEPGKILDKARELVVDTFKKSGQDVKDGMDISLLSIKLKSKKLKEETEIQWAGANNPLWILKKVNGAVELNEITANKQPIGLSENPTPFTTHSLNLSKGDSVFLFTDGLPDQFGGPKNKKYKYKRLQEKLIESNHLSDSERKLFVENDLRNWQQDAEQVDDILLIGFVV